MANRIYESDVSHGTTDGENNNENDVDCGEDSDDGGSDEDEDNAASTSPSVFNAENDSDD